MIKLRPLMAAVVSLLALAALSVACLPAMDDPSHLHDLRLLAIKLSPPELMAPICPSPDAGISLDDLIVFGQPILATPLIVDPNGHGRSVHYDLYGCGSTGDKTCADIDQQVTFASGDISPDAGEYWMEPNIEFAPALAVDSSNTPLLEDVLANDPYQGLGGIRMPLVMHVQAGSEEIYAQKLMVFSCQLFPDMQPNQNPVLPGMQLGGAEWNDGGVPSLEGQTSVTMQPDPYAALQEAYVVPQLDLTPVHLTESWEISWYADLGSFSPTDTGGVDLGGQLSPNVSSWTPDSGFGPQDVHFFFVVRDGRGGMGWLLRTAHWSP